MQQIVIDCRRGKVAYLDLSPEQETQRLEEIEAERGRQAAEEKKAARRLLARALAELREMRQNRDIFGDEDLAEKQAEIDRLKVVLQG